MSKPMEQTNRKARNCKIIMKLIVYYEEKAQMQEDDRAKNELSSLSSIFIFTCNLGPSNQTKLNSLHWKATEAACSSNTDQQKSNSGTHAVMSLIIIHKGSSICSQVTSTIMKNERYRLHMSKAKMNFNTSVTYCLYTISSQLEPLDLRPKNLECATALCHIF